MNKKTLAIVLALGVITSIGYFGGSYVLAENNSPMHASLVSKIAQRFNLKESEVEAVFESVRDERQEEMKQQRGEKLSQAVKDGVITEDQKNALLSKMEEHEEERSEEREAMQKWFSDNGIDETKLRDYLRPEGKGMGDGRGRHMGI